MPSDMAKKRRCRVKRAACGVENRGDGVENRLFGDTEAGFPQWWKT